MASLTKNERSKFGIVALFLAPSLLLYTTLIIYPIFYSAFLSLTDWPGVEPKDWVGHRNFEFLFQDSDFLTSFGNSLRVTLLSIFFQVPVGLTIAFLLFRTKSAIYKAYRGIYFLPVVITSTAIATMFRLIMNNDIGVFSSILEVIGMGRFIRPWLADTSVVLYTVIFVQIWQFIGTYVIIFLAAFQSIDPEIFESAVIDGTNSLQQFLLIACPLVSDVLKFSVVLCFTGSMKSFDISYVMTAGGPGYASSYLGNYLFNSTFGGTGSRFGRGSAVAMVIIVVSAVFTVIFKKLSREKD